ncbi:hypothetical protein ACFE04_017148 [Oxalis oulophora]
MSHLALSVEETISSKVVSPKPRQSQIVLNIDLNLPPPEEYEEEDMTQLKSPAIIPNPTLCMQVLNVHERDSTDDDIISNKRMKCIDEEEGKIDALTKSIIFLEAQRSGKLPPNNRVPWRGDSALDDGKLANKELQATGELDNVRCAIRWGTDFFLKASSRKNRLYVQVGDPDADHACWVRPEKMKTPRTVLKIDTSQPGTEIAAETAAAMASSAMVFKKVDRTYSRRLMNKAKLLFQFAKEHKGTYDGECPFYCSFSGYNDELLWAATWLYKANKRPVYLKYLTEEAISASVAEFSWDLKYAGAQVVLAELFLAGETKLINYKNHIDSFVCSNLPDSPYHQIYVSPGGFVHLRDGANTQYGTSTAMVLSVYSDLLARHNQKVTCGDKQFDSAAVMAFAKQQIDYILGKNPEGRSYMVGFGTNPPQQAHHRGASVPLSDCNKDIACGESFMHWFKKDVPNPNELTGAIVGGPDRNDKFSDKRWDSSNTEPCTYVNSLAVGVLAKLAAP